MKPKLRFKEQFGRTSWPSHSASYGDLKFWVEVDSGTIEVLVYVQLFEWTDKIQIGPRNTVRAGKARCREALAYILAGRYLPVD